MHITKDNIISVIQSIKMEPITIGSKNDISLSCNKPIFKKYKTLYPNTFTSSEILYIFKHQDINQLVDEMFCYCGNKKKYSTTYSKYCSQKCCKQSDEYQNTRKNSWSTTWNSHTKEEKDLIHKKQQQNRVMTKESKLKMVENRRKTISNWTEDKKKQVYNKLAKSVKNIWCNRTDIQKQDIGRKISEALHRIVDNGRTVLQNRQDKIEQTCLSKYGVKNVAKLPTTITKSIETNVDKYGAEHFSQQHMKNVQDLNEEFILTHFVENGYLSQQKCCEYFNISPSYLYNFIRTHNVDIVFNKSLKQQELYEFIKSIYNKTIIRNGRNIIYPLELDIYLPEESVAIEFNGMFWHSVNYGLNKYYHVNKSIMCRDKGIRLIHVYEDEWDDPIKKSIIQDIIKHSLHINNDSRIYARNCKVVNISDKDYKEFCNKNHIQGYRPAAVKLGLMYKDKLVQIASFGKSRYDTNYEWEWVRGCPASNNTVIGGTSKLFKHFIANYSPKSVLCYADFNKFDGSGYKECGFILDKLTVPDKFYFDTKNKVRVNRNPAKYREYTHKVETNEFYLLYGAGNLKFTWHKI